MSLGRLLSPPRIQVESRDFRWCYLSWLRLYCWRVQMYRLHWCPELLDQLCKFVVCPPHKRYLDLRDYTRLAALPQRPIASDPGYHHRKLDCLDRVRLNACDKVTR